MCKRTRKVFFTWLLICIALPNSFSGFEKEPQVAQNFTIIVEAESYAASNFTSFPKSVNGIYSKDCSGLSYLRIYYSPPKEQKLPQLRRSIISPPGYLYLEIPLHINEDGNYQHLWLSIAEQNSRPVAFQWAIHPKLEDPPVTIFHEAVFTREGQSYGSEPFVWRKLGTFGEDMSLKEDEGPYTLLLKFSPDTSHNCFLDSVFLSTEDKSPEMPSAQFAAEQTNFPVNTEDYVVFVPNPIKDVFPTNHPQPEEIIDTIELTVCRGEFEPVTLGIFANKDLGEVTVMAGDLKGDRGTIPAQNVTIYRVENMHKRWERQSPPEQSVLTPEYLFPSNRTVCAQGDTRLFWLSIKVPEEIAGGIYQSPITFSPEKGSIKKLTLKINVFPFKIEKYRKRHTVQYINHRAADYLKYGTPIEWVNVEKELIDIFDHGCDGIATSFGIQTRPRLYIPFELSNYFVSLLQKTGFPDSQASMISIGKVYDDLKKVEDVNAENEFRKIVSDLERIYTSYSFPQPYFLVVDEIQSSTPDDNRVQEFIYKAGLLKGDLYRDHRIASTMTPWCVDEDSAGWDFFDPEVAPLVDYRSYSGWALDRRLPAYDFSDLSNDISVNQDTLFGVYYNQHPAYTKPKFLRVATGLYFWNSPFSVFGTWTYKFWRGEPLDDLDGEFGDQMLVYPNPEDGSPMPSLNWEAFREGVDDLRLLTTLEHLVENAQNKNTPHVINSGTLIEEIRLLINSYGPHFRGIYAYLTPEKLKEIREDCLAAIWGFYRNK
ncbi:glycoside hydrolase domain-containing protein [Acidobacteriota bacterium]